MFMCKIVLNRYYRIFKKYNIKPLTIYLTRIIKISN